MKKSTNISLQVALLAGVWAFIALYQAVGTFFIPTRYYAFRAHETARAPVTERINGPFEPFFIRDDTGSGDLSRLAGVPQLFERHRERFTTDEYGFRNPVGTLDRPCDVVVIGDSFALGSCANDDEILSSVIRRTGLNVYNYSGMRVEWFFCDERFRRQPPKLAILFYAERDVKLEKISFPTVFIDGWEPEKKSPNGATPKFPFQSIRSVNDFYAEINNPRVIRYHAERVYKGFLYAVGLYRFPPTIFWYDAPTRMFFFSESGDRHLDVPAAMADADVVVDELRKCQDYLSRRGIRMLVLIGPDKETIYPDLIPQLRGRDDTGALLDHFFDELRKAGIDSIRTHDILADYRRKHPDELLYFRDDTHMTPVAQELLFEALKDRLPPR